MNIERFQAKLNAFTSFAVKLGALSTCRRAGVGAIVIPTDFSTVLSVGYNGPPAGLDNDMCLGVDAVGSCGCVHAESNAVVKLGDASDSRLICTTSPCETCAGLIINSRKISQVWFVHRYRNLNGVMLLQRAGLICDTLMDNPNLYARWTNAR